MTWTEFYSKVQKLPETTPREWKYAISKRFREDPLTQIDAISPCVFVLSTGRVGTQTLAALLKLVPRTYVYHEPYPRLFGLSQKAYLYGQETVAREILREAFLSARERLLELSRFHQYGFIETGHHVTFLAPVIREALPQAKFIHLVRHPYAVIRSAIRRGWYQNNAYDKTRIFPSPENPLASRWNSLSQIEKVSWLWAETNRWIIDFRNAEDAPPNLLLHSEALFQGEISTLEELYRFVGAALPPKRKIQSVLGRKLNSQQSGSFPPPERWEEEQRELVWEWVGDVAVELGYEK